MNTVGKRRANLFLDLYKQVEDALEEKYRNSRRHYTSAVYEFQKDYESEPVRDKLDICRHIRNLMAHSADMEGEPIVVPSQPVVDALREVLDFVRRPPLAMDFATRAERVLKVGPDQRVLRVMELMEKNGYSHVPVMKDGRFCGVFSVGSVFRYVLRHRGKGLDPEATIKDLRGYLAVDEHRENYLFVSADTSYIEVRRRFEQPKRKNERVAVIFITQDGEPEQPLLGMLTPWDVLGSKRTEEEAGVEQASAQGGAPEQKPQPAPRQKPQTKPKQAPKSSQKQTTKSKQASKSKQKQRRR